MEIGSFDYLDECKAEVATFLCYREKYEDARALFDEILSERVTLLILLRRAYLGAELKEDVTKLNKLDRRIFLQSIRII